MNKRSNVATSWLFAYCLSAIWLLACPSFAGSGATASNFLQISLGARPTALGESFTAISNDVNAIFWNPAGLGFLKHPEASFLYHSYVEATSQGHLSGAFPYKNQVFGVGLNYLGVGDIPAYDIGDNPIASVSASNLSATFAYSRKFYLWRAHPSFWAVSLGYLYEKLDVFSASGASLDLGILGKASLPGVSWGLSLKHLGSPIQFIQEADPLPSQLKAGISYSPFGEKAPLGLWTLLLASDFTYPLLKREKPYFSAGLEIWIYQALSVRAGYKSARDVGSGLSFGFGLQIPTSLFQAGYLNQLRIDYALTNYEVFSNAHQVSLNIRFGAPMAEVLRKPAPFKYIVPTQEQEMQIKSKEEENKNLLNEGLTFYNDKEYEKAAQRFSLIVQRDKTHAAAAAFLVLSLSALERQTEETKLLKSPQKEKPRPERPKEVTQEELRLSQEMYLEAIASYSFGNREKAIELLIEALKINPQHDKARTALEKMSRELLLKR